jgi:hypothetical protein
MNLSALTVFLPVLILGGILLALVFRAAEHRATCPRCGRRFGKHHPRCPNNKWELI